MRYTYYYSSPSPPPRHYHFSHALHWSYELEGSPFSPCGNSDRSCQGPFSSGAAVCPHATMYLAAASRAENIDYLPSGVQTTAMSPCSSIPGGQRGPDRALSQRCTGTYPLHIPASPPQPRPRVPPTLPGPQSCPAACQSLHRQSVPLAARVCCSAPPEPFPCLGGSRVREAGPRPRARPRPSAGPALSLLLHEDNDPLERERDWSHHLASRAVLRLSLSLSALHFWTTLA